MAAHRGILQPKSGEHDDLARRLRTRWRQRPCEGFSRNRSAAAGRPQARFKLTAKSTYLGAGLVRRPQNSRPRRPRMHKTPVEESLQTLASRRRRDVQHLRHAPTAHGRSRLQQDLEKLPRTTVDLSPALNHPRILTRRTALVQ